MQCDIYMKWKVIHYSREMKDSEYLQAQTLKCHADWKKKKKNKGHIVYDSLYKMSRKGRSIVTECRLSHCQGLGV